MAAWHPPRGLLAKFPGCLRLCLIAVICAICVHTSTCKKEDKSIMRAVEMHSDELALRLQRAPQVPTFVHFRTPWCEHCQVFGEHWDALSREYDFYDEVRVVSVDCSGKGSRACMVQGILQYPTAIAFPSGNRYDGSLDSYDELEAWARDALMQFPLTARHLRDEANRKEKGRPVNGAWKVRTRAPVNGCVAWRATHDCDPDAERDPDNDLSCLQEVLGLRSGYCDCGGGRVEKESDCGDDWRKGFNCLDECKPVEGCKGWKATSKCQGDGVKDSKGDQDCRALIESDASGYCECEGGIQTPPVNCTHQPFTCEEKCSRLFKDMKRQELEEAERKKADREARMQRARELGYIK